MKKYLLITIIFSISLLLSWTTTGYSVRFFDVALGREVSIPVVVSEVPQKVEVPAPLYDTVLILRSDYNFSEHRYFEYEVADLSSRDTVQIKMAIKDANGLWWEQKDQHRALVGAHTTFLVELASPNWTLSSPSNLAVAPNFSRVRELRFTAQQPISSFSRYSFQIMGGILCDTWGGSISAATPFTLSDPPSITQLTVNQVTPIENDYISANPEISALLLDTVEGISTWSIQVINAQNSVVVDQLSGNAGNIKTAKVVTFNVSAALGDGRYQIKVTALDASGNTASRNSAIVVVKQAFTLENLLNSPNPFNPNRESTQIDYMLSKPAKVTLYIYTQNGDLQKKIELASGEEGARAGYNRIIWDGRNQFGQTVANGIYLVYILADSDSSLQKGKLKIWVRK